MSTTSPAPLSLRKKEITADYLRILDVHISDLENAIVDHALEIRELAQQLHLHPVHLSTTIKEVTGESTCYHYEMKLVAVSKKMLLTTNMSIGEIAMRLTYDPSNFTKFFKHYTGLTPKKFREQSAGSPDS
ncbi:MAG: helix-turn-helix transcriptional regulator [Chitinophagaceae bacterium]|nr:helix-turn-helix transcriptional regulator [Chitinophagaceae bacterium]